jgi:hypothetical protein
MIKVFYTLIDKENIKKVPQITLQAPVGEITIAKAHGFTD